MRVCNNILTYKRITRSNVSFNFFRFSLNTFSFNGDGWKTLYSAEGKEI